MMPVLLGGHDEHSEIAMLDVTPLITSGIDVQTGTRSWPPAKEGADARRP